MEVQLRRAVCGASKQSVSSPKSKVMQLTTRENKMLDGKEGEAVRIAMSILVDIGEAIEAEEMANIAQVHTDSGFYLGDAGLEFVEHLAELGGKVSVSTTMNNTSFDLERGISYGVSQDLLDKVKRIEKAHLQMGAVPTWTCAPYQDGIIPRFGSLVAWSESNAIAFVNSVIGARTNRTGDLIDICSAVTGKYPKFGLYMDENRKAEVLIKCGDLSQDVLTDPSFYPLLGYLAGHKAGNKVVAIEGIPKSVSVDSLKGLGAAAASSGSIALFHVIGVTPEAQGLEMCLNKEDPVNSFAVTPELIRNMEEKLWTTEAERVDWVGLGCPHFSFPEFRELAKLIDGKKVHKEVKFTVFTSRNIYEWINQLGILEMLNDAGIEIFTDGCLLLFPREMSVTGTMITNSAKAANYIYSQAGLKAAYGSIKDCVESAIEGRTIRRGSEWLL
jgi:predicted aconitase